MDDWRPEGFRNPHHAKVKAGKGNGKDMAFSLVYEVGADAILVALKNDTEAEHCDAGQWIETVAGEFGGPDELEGIGGTWVFIPDPPAEVA